MKLSQGDAWWLGTMLAAFAAIAGIWALRHHQVGRTVPAASQTAAAAGAGHADQEQSETQEAGAEEPRVFTSPLAGTWYEADKDQLASQIDGYLEKVPTRQLDRPCALILPHAGYRWSGQTAAYGIKQLVGRSYRRVIVMGPSHRVPMQNVVSVPDATHYATPLGRVPLDVPLLRQLRKYRVVQSIAEAHDGEHSVQIEVPLLQHVLGPFRLVPIVVGQLDRPTVRRVGRILRGFVDEQTLVVASSDFTHYGASYGYLPFQDDVPRKLQQLDEGSWQQIRKKDVDGLLDYVDRTGTTICGRYGIAILLAMLPAEAKAHRLHYDTSGRQLGDYSSSVSYMSIAFTGKWQRAEPVEPDRQSAGLSDEDRRQLLRLARATLTYVLKNRAVPTPDQLDIRITPAMRQIAGAFVTLHKHGELRGCVGEIWPMRPLFQAVIAQAINAGLNDRRFPPVQLNELEQLDFEISVLTPPRPVASAEQIVIGKHGIVLDKGGHRAVFLPQVAPEQGWDLDETLTQLSLKAGLSADAWRHGATFSVFEAVVFGEERE